jgi:hypothetical protein
MRFFFGGAHFIGGFIRPGISVGADDWRNLTGSSRSGRHEFVYVITSSAGLNKVGRSNDPELRLKTLQTGSPHHLHIAHTLAVPSGTADQIEHEAHAILEQHRYNLEWFSVSANVAIAAVYGAVERLGIDLDAEDVSNEPTWGTLAAYFMPRHGLTWAILIVIATCMVSGFFSTH